jgi:hypothetical protein
MQALFAKVGFMPSGMIHNLDPNDPEIVHYKALDEGYDSARAMSSNEVIA